MVSIFDYEDYRQFLEARIQEMPKRGYGQLTLLAKHLSVHTTLVSQILKGRKDLTTDQAATAIDFLGLTELEAEYFILLVQMKRAGNNAAKRIYSKQIERLKVQSYSLSKRIKAERKLTEAQRATFYSDWRYSAIRQVTAIDEISDVTAITDFLGLPRKRVQAAVNFLLKTELCKLVGGRLRPGPLSTHLESSSPWIGVHHSNWRARALQALNQEALENLHYTCPLTVSKRDARVIREKIIANIQDINSIVDPSPSEKLYCLNIDWFQEGK